MKPVYLRFSGLHSYIEEQYIDFTALIGAGVFGIFGPTGSGKSTILDAITLALYGTVERAPKKTKEGIINQYCNQAAVSFAFELNDTAGAHRYRVERTFRRGKTADSAEASQARFVELACEAPGQEAVLRVIADKAGAVTTSVEEALGLTVVDFCRAVVLPQGKFAEFLSLQGSERRSMLQRLFGLELFGDRLLQQVKRELMVDESALGALQARIGELGDASSAAAQEAADKARIAAVEKEQAALQAAEIEREYAAWERVWAWQTDLDTALRHIAELAGKESAVHTQEYELDAAERAEQVRGSLAQSKAAEVELRAAEANLGSSRSQVTQAASLLESVRSRRANAERVWTEESPSLYSRQTDLRRATEKEQALLQVQSQLAVKQKELATVRSTLNNLAEQTVHYENEAAQAAAGLAQVRDDIATCMVDPDLRERVTASLAAMKSLAVTEQQLLKERRECITCEAALHEADRHLRQAKEVADSTGAELTQALQHMNAHRQTKPWDEQELQFRRSSWQEDARLADQVRVIYPPLNAALQEEQRILSDLIQAEKRHAQAQQARADTEAALRMAKEALSAAEQAQTAAQYANMSATLAAQLATGKPCPVCGAIEHPRIAEASDSEQQAQLAQEIADKRAALTHAENALQKTIGEQTQASVHIQTLQGSLARFRSDYARLAADLSSLRARLPGVWRELDSSNLQKALCQAETSLKQKEASLQQWQQATQRLEAGVRDLTAAAAEADKQLTACEIKAESAQKQHLQAIYRAQNVSNQLDTERKALDQARGNLTISEIQRLSEQIARWDREIVALRNQEAKWAAREKEVATQLTEARRQVESIRQRESQAQADSQALLRQCNDVAQEVQTLIGEGTTAAKALATVNDRLDELAKGRNIIAEAEAHAGEAHQQALQAFAGADQRVATALQRHRVAGEELAEALVANGFSSLDAAMYSLRSAETRDGLKSHITAFRREQERWQQEKTRLEQELTGRHLTQEEWCSWQEKITVARSTRDAALQAAALASKAYDDVRQRHERWVELTGQATVLTDRVGRLQDLSQLLRGNAFVDFLAEQQLQQVAYTASAHLGALTRYRYALEVASDGTFIIRDDTAGGYRRAVHTLSGGETFLTSLALALALSSQIQLRGRYPLQFFFLDEGFGALDQELLDVAMTALERLHLARLHVGVISHVPELRNRIMRRLIVVPATPGERGSKVAVDQV